MSSPTPFLNAALDVVIATTGDIAADLSTLRPLLRNAIFSAYATDKVENTPIASFPDGADGVPMKSATFAIAPVQDLHGYDNPWPAGGGKNLFGGADGTFSNGSVREVVVANGVMSYKVNTSAGSAYFLVEGIITSSMVANKTLKAGTYIFSIATNAISEANLATLRLNLSDGTAVSPNSSFTLSADADIVSITSTATIQYSTGTYTLQIQIESGSTATAWTPYSNICPISGFTGAEITADGKNFIDEASLAATGITYSNGVLTGTASAFSVAYGPNGTTIAVPHEQFTLSLEAYTDAEGGSDGQGLFINVYYTDGTLESLRLPNATASFTAFTFTTDAGKTPASMGISFGAKGGNTWHIRKMQVETGITATTYEPYIGTTHDITWQDGAGTVYGGTLQYLGGDAWRLTMTMVNVDMGSLNWAYASGAQVFYANASYIKAPASNSQVANIICSMYPTFSADGVYNGALGVAISITPQVWVHDPNYSDAATFKTAMSGVQLVYELATPVVYDLTGEELATVLGTNNVFSNTGDVNEIVYRADTALYIDKKLAEA